MSVLEVSAGDQYVVATGDTPLLEIWAALPSGLYPPFPPVELPGGVGGLVTRGGFGQTFFFASEVLGAQFVSRSGRVIEAGGRVVKNVQGFDLVRPLVGSVGRLGEVRRVTLRLRPGPAFSHLARPGTLEDAVDLGPRFLWQDGPQLHAVHFGPAREVERLRQGFGGEEQPEPLDYTACFPGGMGIGASDLRDRRFSWADGGAAPEVPALFERVAAAL